MTLQRAQIITGSELWDFDKALASIRRTAGMELPARFWSENDFRRFIPVHVVWEITLACDLKCLHCGSRAGHRRPSELSTAECIEVVDALARLGTREVTLIGGEAYLRKDWVDIIRAVRSHGMYCAIQTGGRNLTPQRISDAVAAGLNGLGVSLDGLAPLHDKLRGVQGSFLRALDTLKRAREADLNISVNTQIGADTIPDLPELMDTIIDVGAQQWQIQITVAMGNAVEHPELLLQPFRILELMPLLARLYHEGAERGLLMAVGNNIGYFGPYEHVWRGFGDERVHWSGCRPGKPCSRSRLMALSKAVRPWRRSDLRGATSVISISRRSGGPARKSTLDACDPWTISGDSAAPAITRRSAAAGAPGPPTPSWAAPATIPIATIGRWSCKKRAFANAWSKPVTQRQLRSPWGSLS